ncbi:hypothetical protein [Vibrio anguillarum]|uniref:hypothetical protein n=2 Tax=Vibrio TaxID=662 RepID=UPI0002E7E9DE|nr:hypothetical protein [Vibrio anguillarum]OEE39004.1 hypothetical protein A1QU_02540 [Vibrio anguillarum]
MSTAFSSLKNMMIARINLSQSELKKLETMQVKTIRNVDFKRLENTLISKKTPMEMKNRIMIVLNKKNQDENCVTIFARFKPDQVIDLGVYGTVSDALKNLLKDKQNLLNEPTTREIKQHFACYGVGLIEREVNSAQVKETIKKFLEWIRVDRKDTGKSGLQAALMSEVDKAKLDVGLASVEWRMSVTNQINRSVEIQINEYLSGHAERNKIVTSSGTTLTAHAIEDWLTQYTA